MNKKLGKIGSLFAFIYVCSGMGLFATLFVPVRDKSEFHETTVLFLGAWLSLYLLTFVMLFLAKYRLKSTYFLVLALPAYFLLSALWSNVPSNTLQYSLALGCNFLFSIFLWLHFPVMRFIKLTYIAISVMCVVGCVLYFLNIELAIYEDIHSRDNIFGWSSWKGLFNHKITAGFYSSMGAMLALVLVKGAVRYIYYLFFVYLVILSGSSGGLFLLAAGTVLVFLMTYISTRRNVYISSLFLSITLLFGASIIFFYYFVDVLDLLGRDITLTGRTTLWKWGLDIASERPILGWGYVGYNGSESAANYSWIFREFQNYAVPHFHNSYIQYLAEFGYVGGAIIIFTHFSIVVALAMNFETTRSRTAICALSIYLYLMLSAIFMHSLGRYNDFGMIATGYFLVMLLARRENVKSDMVEYVR